MESFSASLKTECAHQAQFHIRAAAKASVFKYIEVFGNRQRLHSALGYCPQARADMTEVTSPCRPRHDILIPSLHSQGEV